MRLHKTVSNRPARLALTMIPATALAVTLVACGGSGGGSTATTKPGTPAAPTSTAPATSSPASADASTSVLAGTWHGQYSGSYQGTFVINWHQSGSRLNGHITISNPTGTLVIHGQLAGGSIKFGTVGSYAITYSGSVSGNSMSGHWQIQDQGQGGNWSATKG